MVQIHSPRPFNSLSPNALRRCVAFVFYRVCSARSAITLLRKIGQLETEPDLFCPVLAEFHILGQLLSVPR